MSVQVYPVSNFPDEAVNAVSKKAVQDHHAQFSTTCRMLQQVRGCFMHFTWCIHCSSLRVKLGAKCLHRANGGLQSYLLLSLLSCSVGMRKLSCPFKNSCKELTVLGLPLSAREDGL